MSPPSAVGYANGIAQSIVSLARCVGPVIGGYVSLRSLLFLSRTVLTSSGLWVNAALVCERARPSIRVLPRVRHLRGSLCLDSCPELPHSVNVGQRPPVLCTRPLGLEHFSRFEFRTTNLLCLLSIRFLLISSRNGLSAVAAPLRIHLRMSVNHLSPTSCLSIALSPPNGLVCILPLIVCGLGDARREEVYTRDEPV